MATWSQRQLIRAMEKCIWFQFHENAAVMAVREILACPYVVIKSFIWIELFGNKHVQVFLFDLRICLLDSSV